MMIAVLTHSIETFCAHVAEAQANKAQCARLASRVNMLGERIQALAHVKNTSQFNKTIDKIVAQINQCDELVQYFIGRDWWKRVVKSGRDTKKFEHCNAELQRLVEELNIGIQTQQLFDHDDDQADLANDLTFIAENQRFIVDSHQQALAKLQTIHQHHHEAKIIHQRQYDSLVSMLENITAHSSGGHNKVESKKQIHYANIRFHKLIGKSDRASVYFGEYDQQEVAIKTLACSLDSSTKKLFSHEVEVMSRLNSPHVVSFYGACLEAQNPSVLMEHMPNGNLSDRLASSRSELTSVQKTKILNGVGRGLHYLHQEGVVHGSLSSRHVLLTSSFDAKLFGFGLSKTIASSIIDIQQLSSDVAWLAPEQLNSGEITEAGDVYSLGVLMWSLLTGLEPLAGLNIAEIKRQAALGSKREIIPSYIAESYRQLISQCWSLDPKERPHLQDIIPKLVVIDSPTPERRLAMAHYSETAGDYVSAAQHYQRAGEKGEPRGFSSLAGLFRQGKGVQKSASQALSCYEQAAEQGHARSAYNAGQMLEYGDGVAKNLNRAQFFYQQAQAGNITEASQRLVRVKEKLGL